MTTRRIGVFGGTFDPVHIGHLIIATEVKYRLELERVLFVPAGDPPHKPDAPISPAHDRVAMLERAIGGRSGLEIDRVDLDRPGKSFTRDTLETLKERNPGSELYFLAGEDSLRDLHRWRDPERILELAIFVVAPRSGEAIELEGIYERLPAARGRVLIVNIPLIGVSSTDLRERVRIGAPIEFQVADEVAAYIRTNRLYQ